MFTQKNQHNYDGNLSKVKAILMEEYSDVTLKINGYLSLLLIFQSFLSFRVLSFQYTWLWCLTYRTQMCVYLNPYGCKLGSDRWILSL